MPTPAKSSSNSDLVVPLFFGALVGWPTFILFRHLSPDSWPHAAMGWLAHLGGFATTATTRGGIAAALVAVIGLVVGALLDGILQEKRKMSAAMKDVRESMRREQLKAKLDGKIEKKDEDRAWENTYGRPERQSGQATFGFVGACAVGFGLLTLVLAHFLL